MVDTLRELQRQAEQWHERFVGSIGYSLVGDHEVGNAEQRRCVSRKAAHGDVVLDVAVCLRVHV